MVDRRKNDVKRSLILAGGGLKVAFQAGALQVWLDEAGLEFDHVDAASGGVFNLAMLCQGKTGTQIADSWRRLDPKDGVHLDANAFLKLFYAQSLFTLDNYRDRVFPAWGLDWNRIQATKLEATFNVYNFSKHELVVLEPHDMNEDLLVAGVSLPMWFPPVRIDDQVYVDAVYATDANLEEAIRRGADEIWVIWTVSDRGEWRDGFVAQYFQIIEASAVANYRAIRRRIERNNAALANGEHSEFGRPITVKELKADVALHYLVDFSQDRLVEAVNLGVKRAREWCLENGIPLVRTTGDYPVEVHEAATRLSFTEELKGFVTAGELDFERGAAEGRKNGTNLQFKLTITVDGVNRFVTRPEHDAAAVGTLQGVALGGEFPVERGVFNLLVDESDSSVKSMFYRLFFHDAEHRPLTLSGRKVVRDDPGIDVWSDTTTLFTRILRGHVTEEEERAAEADAQHFGQMVMASGILRIHLTDFLRQLTTLRVEGPTLADRTSAAVRFGRLFFGKLWDAYARDVLIAGPF